MLQGETRDIFTCMYIHAYMYVYMYKVHSTYFIKYILLSVKKNIYMRSLKKKWIKFFFQIHMYNLKKTKVFTEWFKNVCKCLIKIKRNNT